MTSHNNSEDELETLFKTFDEQFAEVSQKISLLERDLKTARQKRDAEV
jgi:hypothetical protein